MDNIMYIHTNRSTPDELQRYLDDVADVGAGLYAGGGYDTIDAGGRPEIVGKDGNGVSRPDAQHTTCFDTVKPKHGATGFYCLDAAVYYAGEAWVSTLPDFDDYTGLYSVDDISQWEAPTGDV
jgi:hypothetical protein